MIKSMTHQTYLSIHCENNSWHRLEISEDLKKEKRMHHCYCSGQPSTPPLLPLCPHPPTTTIKNKFRKRKSPSRVNPPPPPQTISIKGKTDSQVVIS